MRTINRIDGKIFAQMMISGANHLYNNKQTVDDLNVFPVPDGDTGTNMSLTVKNMAAELSQKNMDSISKTADLASFSTLRGARGNSGVILSQFFRGISRYLKGQDTCDTLTFARALEKGSDAAYKAVMNPTEGTILTVAREAAAGALEAAVSSDDFTVVFERIVERGNHALERTTDMLPALKQAGVVDAGGQGWMFILEGVLLYLKGEQVEALQKEPEPASKVKKAEKPQAAIDTQDIKFKYCTEFIIEKYKENTGIEDFKSAIAPKGDCMLVIDDASVVKVHIHTNHPGFVLEEAVKIGEMINLKIDNMKHQHHNLIEQDVPKEESGKQDDSGKNADVNVQKKKKAVKKTDSAKEEPMKKTGFVAICTGKGLAEILTDLGVDRLIEGGQTMNPSTDDILKAINKVKAETIFVFPNNKNIIMAANQAKSICQKNVIVLPTKNIPQCISALMSYRADKEDDVNERNMLKAIEHVGTAQVTYAVRDTELDGKQIKKGDILGIAGSHIQVVGDSPERVCEELVDLLVKEDEDREFITVYCGKGIRKPKAEKLEKLLEETYEDFEVSVKRGGQPLYYYIISVE